MAAPVQPWIQEAKSAWHASLYHCRYKSGQIPDSSAEGGIMGVSPSKCDSQPQPEKLLVVIVMIAIVLPPLPSGRIVLATGTNQLNRALK